MQTLQFGVAVAFLLISFAGIVASVTIRFRERPTYKDLNEHCRYRSREFGHKYATREELLRMEALISERNGQLKDIQNSLKTLLDRL